MARSPRIRVAPAAADDLGTVADLVHGDAAAIATFGGFYGRAPETLAPLLGADRHLWLISVDNIAAGFIDADRTGDIVHLAIFVAEVMRRQGVATGALARMLGQLPWNDITTLRLAIAPENTASKALAAAAGYRLDGVSTFGDELWERQAPTARRARSGPERFLYPDGSIDRYPLNTEQRRELLAMIVERAVSVDAVLTERELGEALAPFSRDVATLRRYLVDFELLERSRDGSSYARVAGASRA